jgi:hypothetical protein
MFEFKRRDLMIFEFTLDSIAWRLHSTAYPAKSMDQKEGYRWKRKTLLYP